MYLVRATKELPIPKGGVKLPLGSGRTVRIANHKSKVCVTEAEYKSRSHYLEVLGVCSEFPVKEYRAPQKREPCTPCTQKRLRNQKPASEEDEGMKCDFVLDRDYGISVRWRCIRCGLRTDPIQKDRWVSAVCRKKGIGDYIHIVTEFLRIPYCTACSERRRKLNDLHRSWYRKLRGPKNATYLERSPGQVPAATPGWSEGYVRRFWRRLTRLLLPTSTGQSKRRK